MISGQRKKGENGDEGEHKAEKYVQCSAARRRQSDWNGLHLKGTPPRWLTAAIDAEPPERREIPEQPLLSRCQHRFPGKTGPEESRYPPPARNISGWMSVQ